MSRNIEPISSLSKNITIAIMRTKGYIKRWL